MEFDSEAITAAGFGADTVAFERLGLRGYSYKSKPHSGGRAESSGPSVAWAGGARRTAYSLIVWPPSGGGGP